MMPRILYVPKLLHINSTLVASTRERERGSGNSNRLVGREVKS
jgi:hypothetical protein